VSDWIRKTWLFLEGRFTRPAALFFLASALCACYSPITLAQAPEGPVPASAPASHPEPDSKKPTVFKINYVGDKTVYLDGGRNADLQDGMKLSVVEAPPDGVIAEGIQYRGYEHVAEVVVSSVSDSSALCDVVKADREVKVGQAAFLTPESVHDRRQAELATDEDKYPILMTFTYGDPLDEEVRETREAQVTRLTPMQRSQGRIGFDYGGTNEPGGFSSRQMGLVIDADMRNIGGTFWNFVGSWRGNFGTSNTTLAGSGTQTLTDLVNRTYRIGLTYQSPYSPVTLGVGRLFLQEVRSRSYFWLFCRLDSGSFLLEL
jgi:hypothetical protein